MEWKIADVAGQSEVQAGLEKGDCDKARRKLPEMKARISN